MPLFTWEQSRESLFAEENKSNNIKLSELVSHGPRMWVGGAMKYHRVWRILASEDNLSSSSKICSSGCGYKY